LGEGRREDLVGKPGRCFASVAAASPRIELSGERPMLFYFGAHEESAMAGVIAKQARRMCYP
jgi:hypothetical protein